MSRDPMIGFELRLDQLLEQTRPKARKARGGVCPPHDWYERERRWGEPEAGARRKTTPWGSRILVVTACRRCGKRRGTTERRGGKARALGSVERGPRGGQTEVQSYLFPRALWTEQRAGAWLERHGLASNALDVTDRYYRFRQAPPSRFRRMRTKCIARKRGKCLIKTIIGVR